MNKSEELKIPSPAYDGISKQAGGERKESGSDFDLAIIGGRVIDPETKMDRIADIFIRDVVLGAALLEFPACVHQDNIALTMGKFMAIQQNDDARGGGVIE